MNSLPKRLYTLDLARFVASISVVFWHWQHFSRTSAKEAANFQSSDQPFYSIFKIFYHPDFDGVSFFFLLSGFVFFWLYIQRVQENKISFKNFMLARLARLYPLHLLSLSLVLLFQAIYTFYSSEAFVYKFNDAYHYFLNLFFASSWGLEGGRSFNGPVWAVSIEILLYLIFFLLVKQKWVNPLLCLIISVASFVYSHLFPTHPLFYGTTAFFLGGLLFYTVKYLMNNFSKMKYLIYGVCALAWALVIMNVYVIDITEDLLKFKFIRYSMIVGFPIYVVIPSTFATLIFIESHLAKNGSNIRNYIKKLSALGNITYSIYLLHFPLQLLFAIAVTLGLLNPQFYLSGFWMIIYFSILLVIAQLSYRNIEMPMKEKIKGYISKSS